MKPHVVFAALALGLIACSSGNDGATAPVPFDPFGIEPAGSSGAEPTGAKEVQPGTSSSLQRLCETYCERSTSVCYGSGYCDAYSCHVLSARYPGCVAEMQAFFACATRAPIECGTYGPEVPACDGPSQSVQNCIGYPSPE